MSSQLEPVAMELEVISPVFVEGQSKEYLNEKGSKEQDDRHTQAFETRALVGPRASRL